MNNQTACNIERTRKDYEKEIWRVANRLNMPEIFQGASTDTAWLTCFYLAVRSEDTKMAEHLTTLCNGIDALPVAAGAEGKGQPII